MLHETPRGLPELDAGITATSGESTIIAGPNPGETAPALCRAAVGVQMTVWTVDPKRYWERISFIRRAFSVLSALTLLITLALAVSLYRENRAAQDRVLERASDQARQTSSRLDGVCRRVMHSADTLAADLSRVRISEDRLLDRLRALQRSHAVVYSAGVRYAPFKRSRRRRVFSPCIIRGTGGEKPRLLWREEKTAEENKWFSRALTEGPLWGEPRFAPEAQRLVATYYAPFTREDKETGVRESIGVVEVSCSTNDLAALLFSFDLGAPGYAFLTTRTGRFLCLERRFAMAERGSLAAGGRTRPILRREWASGQAIPLPRHRPEHRAARLVYRRASPKQRLGPGQRHRCRAAVALGGNHGKAPHPDGDRNAPLPAHPPRRAAGGNLRRPEASDSLGGKRRGLPGGGGRYRPRLASRLHHSPTGCPPDAVFARDHDGFFASASSTRGRASRRS